MCGESGVFPCFSPFLPLRSPPLTFKCDSAIIFGNFRMTEGVAKSPDYLSFCAMFPQLRAIRHTTSYDYYIVDHVPNPPFRFHPLDSLDIHLPSALVEDVPGDIPVEPVSVTSLTLRSHEEFMLHLPGPFTDSEPDWLHNVVRQVKDVQQLNLHMGLEDDADRWSPYYSNLPSYDPFPGFRKEDFPDLQELNIYFTTRYRSDEENPCDLVSCAKLSLDILLMCHIPPQQRFTHFLTHFAPTIRHIRFFVQYPDPVDIIEYIRSLPPGILPHDRSLLASINRYFPTLEQIDTFLNKIAEAIPALQTFDLKFDDERAHPPSLIHYSASIQREEKGSAMVPVITTHARAIDGEGMAWLVESAAELMGIGMDPAGLGFGGGWGDALDEDDDVGEFEDDFFDEAAVDEVWDM